MAYIIDASSLVEAKDRYYGFDFCPGYWEWLEKKGSEGRILSIQPILKELTDRNDELSEWAKIRGSGFFLPLCEGTIEVVREITTWVNSTDFKTHLVSDFFKGADPFLIAYAKANGHTVVTDETMPPDANYRKKVKIPVVCQKFGVPCVGPYEMLRAEGVRLILSP